MFESFVIIFVARSESRKRYTYETESRLRSDDFGPRSEEMRVTSFFHLRVNMSVAYGRY